MIIRLIFIVITTLYLSGCGVGSIFGSHVSDTDYSVLNEKTVTPTDASNTAIETAIETALSTNRLAFEVDESSIIGSSDSDIFLQSTTSPSPASHDNGDWKLSTPTVSLSSSASSVVDNGSNLTITATATETSFQDITVVIGTSGSATEGSDYATVLDITISAGSTTGTAAFDPTADTAGE
ncbi:hypothetical protein PQZ70_02580, partial [Candidatus Pseudothioglobus singularis]|nr:hypothetical protein [Candidatus Pseudothioglobus singularis]